MKANVGGFALRWKKTENTNGLHEHKGTAGRITRNKKPNWMVNGNKHRKKQNT